MDSGLFRTFSLVRIGALPLSALWSLTTRLNGGIPTVRNLDAPQFFTITKKSSVSVRSVLRSRLWSNGYWPTAVVSSPPLSSINLTAGLLSYCKFSIVYLDNWIDRFFYLGVWNKSTCILYILETSIRAQWSFLFSFFFPIPLMISEDPEFGVGASILKPPTRHELPGPPESAFLFFSLW